MISRQSDDQSISKTISVRDDGVLLGSSVDLLTQAICLIRVTSKYKHRCRVYNSSYSQGGRGIPMSSTPRTPPSSLEFAPCAFTPNNRPSLHAEETSGVQMHTDGFQTPKRRILAEWAKAPTSQSLNIANPLSAQPWVAEAAAPSLLLLLVLLRNASCCPFSHCTVAVVLSKKADNIYPTCE